MKKILVTGAAGFLGSHCLHELLYKNFEIYALDKVKQQYPDTKVNWVITDLREPGQVEQMLNNIKPDYLLHLAWKMEAGMKLNSAVNKEWVGISMDLIRKFAEVGGKKIVVSGSCAEYKWGDYMYNEETTPMEPQSVYGRSKHELHQMVSTFCAQNNIDYTWGRIFFMYGPYENEKRLVPYVIHSILNEKKVLTTHGNQTYDYLYVEDVARALVSLIDIDFNGAVNICSGQPIKLKDLIFKIAHHMNGSHLVQLGGVNSNKCHYHNIVGNNSLLKMITNWEQSISIDKGILQTIQWILNNSQKE